MAVLTKKTPKNQLSLQIIKPPAHSTFSPSSPLKEKTFHVLIRQAAPHRTSRHLLQRPRTETPSVRAAPVPGSRRSRPARPRALSAAPRTCAAAAAPSRGAGSASGSRDPAP